MDRDGKRDKRKQIVRDLDGILPEDVDRRQFLKASAAGMTGTILAGCLGGEDDGSDVVWRQPWFATMSWAPAHIADVEGFFTDQGISPPDVQDGDGSPDTVRRIGTGEAEVGHADIGSAISGLAEGHDATVIGMSRQRIILGMTWREDMVSGPEDLEGSEVALGSPFAEQTWPMMVDLLDVDGDQIDANYADAGVALGQLSSGDVGAVYMGMNGQTQLHAQQEAGEIDAELGTIGVNQLSDVNGYPLLVNTDWLEGGSDNVDYLTGLLSGYSHAIKWCVTNPEETINIMRDEVNPELAANPDRELEDRMKVNIGINLGPFVEDGGGFLDWNEEWARNTFDTVGPSLVEDESDIPEYDDVVDRSIVEDADLATMSSDEWNAATEWAEPVIDWFEP